MSTACSSAYATSVQLPAGSCRLQLPPHTCITPSSQATHGNLLSDACKSGMWHNAMPTDAMILATMSSMHPVLSGITDQLNLAHLNAHAPKVHERQYGIFHQEACQSRVLDISKCRGDSIVSGCLLGRYLTSGLAIHMSLHHPMRQPQVVLLLTQHYVTQYVSHRWCCC